MSNAHGKGSIACSECGVRAAPENLGGWSLAVLALTPLEPLALLGERASTTDVLCPACAAKVRTMMKQQGDGDAVEQA